MKPLVMGIFGRNVVALRSVRIGLSLLALLGILPAALYFIAQRLQPLKLWQFAPYQGPGSGAVFGADELGRDLFGRALLAGSLSLAVAAGAVIVAWTLAIFLGSLAGWRRNSVIGRLVGYGLDLLQTIPFIVLTVALSSVLRPGFTGIALIMGVVASAGPARIVIAELRRTRSARHITAQIALGHPPGLVFRTAFLPRITFPPALWLLLILPELLTVDAGLSLFGLGAQPPIPSLGRMIYDGLNQAQAGWWIPAAPLIVLLCLVIACHFVSERIRRTLVRES